MSSNEPSQETNQLSLEEILTRPASEFGNDSSIELAWMSTAVRHMEVYYKLISTVQPTHTIKLSSDDEFIFQEFRKRFPELNVECLTEEMIKSTEAKEKWRNFLLEIKDIVEDYNFATLLRLDCHSNYSESNSIVVPRAQFAAIEIARNREGLNVDLPTEISD